MCVCNNTHITFRCIYIYIKCINCCAFAFLPFIFCLETWGTWDYSSRYKLAVNLYSIRAGRNINLQFIINYETLRKLYSSWWNYFLFYSSQFFYFKFLFGLCYRLYCSSHTRFLQEPFGSLGPLGCDPINPWSPFSSRICKRLSPGAGYANTSFFAFQWPGHICTVHC